MTSRATIAPGVIATAEFLGDPGARVFTVTTGPTTPPRARLIVAQPFGAEAARNYRREVDLGRLLAVRGVETVRFHYRGTGQSDPVERIDLTSMLADAELVGSTGTSMPTVWMGTRMGAYVAAASSDGPFVLWDPVIDPNAYFREVMRAAVFSAFKKDDPGTAPKADLLRHLQAEGRVDVLGYELTHQLYRQVCEAPALRTLPVGSRRIRIIDIRRRGTPRGEVNRLAEVWRGAGAHVTVEAVALNEPWWYGARAGSAADDGSEATHRLLESTAGFVDEAAS